MTNASKYGILMPGVDNFIQVTVVRDTKEERTGCPCWLTMELSDVARVSDRARVELLEDGASVCSETVSGKDIRNGQFERTVLKGIIICNPSNPSGKVFTEEELKTIADLCIRYDVYAIMDEVYEHIIYDGRKHVYMNSIPGMWERTVSCSSLSKTYSVTGWRLGYAIAPENIMARIRQYHDFNAVGCPSPLMEAAVVGLNMPLSYYDEFGAHYAHMKKIFTEGMRDIGIPFTDPEGTYFVLADISPYLKKGQSDVDFCEQLARKAGVGAVPGSSFFNEPINNIVRLHFAKKDETLYAALDRLNHIKDMM